MDPKVKSLSNKIQKSEQDKNLLVSDLEKLKKSCKTVKRIIPEIDDFGNIMEVLFLVFRESIASTNEDKKYFLSKLKMFNEMGDALSDYLSELVDVAHEATLKDDDEPNNNILIKASKSIKKANLSLDKAIKAAKNTSTKEGSKMEKELSNLKNQTRKIRKSIKPKKKK